MPESLRQRRSPPPCQTGPSVPTPGRVAHARQTADRTAATETIKILHVFSRMDRTGPGNRTLELLRHVDRRRYRLQFCALSGRPGDLDDEIAALGSCVHLLKLSRAGFPRRFRRLLRRQRFDVVHAHMHYHSGYFLRIARQCGVPIRVVHFRNCRSDDVSPWWRKLLKRLVSPWVDRYAHQATMRRWLDRHATTILAVSRATMASVWGPDWASDPRCRVIYNGVDGSVFDGAADRDGVRREFGLPGHAPLCIHVGRIAEQKNHVRLVSIFAELLRRRPAARLLLVGRVDTTTADRSLRRRIEELGIADRVVFGGERADVPRLLKAADVLVFPSLWEGFPGAVLEASAAGTPVVSSDLPGIREIAERIAGVRPLSLELTDEHWAWVIDETLDTPVSDDLRQAARRAFASSQFTVDRSARMTCRIWEGGSNAHSAGGAARG